MANSFRAPAVGGTAEKNLYKVFEKAFKDTVYKISYHPKDLKHLYEDVALPADVLEQIFCPDEKAMKNAKRRGWGVSPDFSITNTLTGKILFGEIKRQDGWVEGKNQAPGGATLMNACGKLIYSRPNQSIQTNRRYYRSRYFTFLGRIRRRYYARSKTKPGDCFLV